MIKAIKYGQKRRVIICDCCKALLEFEKEDLKIVQTGLNEYDTQFKCPVCDEIVKVK